VGSSSSSTTSKIRAESGPLLGCRLTSDEPDETVADAFSGPDMALAFRWNPGAGTWQLFARL
jgi:hypothetical protein